MVSTTMPVITTQDVTDIDVSMATFNGTVVSIGDPAYRERGFVYGTIQNPSVETATKKIVAGTESGVFSANITGLTVQTTYYVRVYAANNKGITYGEQVSFSTESTYYYILSDAGIMVQKKDITEGCIDWTSANSLCENSAVGGHVDWRLPTIEELSTLYSERDKIGGFRKDGAYSFYSYWSSTSAYDEGYYVLSFSSGSQYSTHYTINTYGSLAS